MWTGRRSLGCLLSGIGGVALVLALVALSSAPTAAHQLQPELTQSPAERLAEPTLPANPSPADRGAQDYWLRCMACHGDRGQGLTDEFRHLYPPDHQNCWTSGCHGDRPYEGGFTLPDRIPPVIGPQALTRFDDAQTLSQYVRGAMPWHDPGSLSSQEHDRIIAFLLDENDMEAGEALFEQDPGSSSGASPNGSAGADPHRPERDPARSPTGVVMTLLAVVLLSAFLVSRYRVSD